MLTTLTPRDLFAVRKSPSKLAGARLRGTRVMTIQVQWLPAQCVSLFAFKWLPAQCVSLFAFITSSAARSFSMKPRMIVSDFTVDCWSVE
jgi:hypothetical protein